MKTKRMKKLLMGMGLSRNQVNHMVKEQRLKGSSKISNAGLLLRCQPQSFQSHAGVNWLPYVKSFVLGVKHMTSKQKARRCWNTGEPARDDEFEPAHLPRRITHFGGFYKR